MERLSNTIAAYERYLQKLPADNDTVPDEIAAVIDANPDLESSPGLALTDEVVERYHEAHEVGFYEGGIDFWAEYGGSVETTPS